MNLQEHLIARADEIEGFAADVDAVAPSGCDVYTAALLRKAAHELGRLQGKESVWQMLHGVKARFDGGGNE